MSKKTIIIISATIVAYLAALSVQMRFISEHQLLTVETLTMLIESDKMGMSLVKKLAEAVGGLNESTKKIAQDQDAMRFEFGLHSSEPNTKNFQIDEVNSKCSCEDRCFGSDEDGILKSYPTDDDCIQNVFDEQGGEINVMPNNH